jgi:hypothetical protein
MAIFIEAAGPRTGNHVGYYQRQRNLIGQFFSQVTGQTGQTGLRL